MRFNIFKCFSSTIGSGEEGALPLPSTGSLETPEHFSSLLGSSGSTGSFVILVLGVAFALLWISR